MSLLVKAVLVALVTWLTFFDKYCTQFFTYRPIVIGPIIGLIMAACNFRANGHVLQKYGALCMDSAQAGGRC